MPLSGPSADDVGWVKAKPQTQHVQGTLPNMRWVIAAARPNLQCGDKLWTAEVAAPFGGTDEMLKDLKGKVFKDREVRFRAVEEGKGVVRVM